MENKTYGKITLRDYQHEIVENTKNHIRKQLKGEEKNTPSYIEAYVGAGKTLVIAALAHHCQSVGAKMLVLARTGELIEQNYDECVAFGVRGSLFSASINNTKSTHFGVVLGTEGTVVNALNTSFTGDLDENGKRLGWIPHVICIDENHQCPWEDILKNGDMAYSRILNHFKRINPKVCVVGLTGSPYRGVESIKGPYWGKVIEPVVSREFLVSNGFLMPTVFGYGHDDANYDLSEFNNINEVGTSDFSNSDLESMHSKMKVENTKFIMLELQEVMKNRISAMVTCAGKKHCEEAASFLPYDEYAIITESTPAKERRQVINGAKKGLLNKRGTLRYKYLIQVGCLSVGVNIPLIDTSVLLRRIGSLTLLTQLLGRGMRLLKDEHIEAGYMKSDHMVLDFSGTMDAMHELFNDPLLEEASLSHAKEKGEYIDCPICATKNSPYARRCIGADTVGDQPDNRCGHWWKFRTCDDEVMNGITIGKGCGHRNDIAARSCSNCGKYLIDPNDRLTRKHYSDDDWKPVQKMTMEIIGKEHDALKVKYHLDCFGLDGQQEIAEVIYWATNKGGKQIFQSKFVNRHMKQGLWSKVKSAKLDDLVNGDLLRQPLFITHRHNAKGESIVHGVDFTGTRYKAAE